MNELLSGHDSYRVEKAILLTRKMRAAAITASDHGLPPDIQQQKEQKVLADAETLAMATAKLFVAAISDNNHTEQGTNLEEALGELCGKYDKFRPYKYSGVPAVNSVGKLERDASSLGVLWEHTIDHQYRRRNAIPLPIDELLSAQVGIISPLATDYHRAMLGKEFIEQNVKRECFRLKPTAPHIGLRYVILPKNEDGSPVFQDCETIGVYVDVNNYGDTGKVVFEAVKEAYPHKNVYGSNGNTDYAK